MMFCSSSAYADEEVIQAGEELRLVFTIGDVKKAAGLSMTAFYDDDILSAESMSCTVSGSDYYLGNPGKIRWSFIVYDGKDFNNESIAEVVLKTRKQCTVDEMNLSYECEELFDPDLNPLSDNLNKLFSVKLVHDNSSFTIYEAGNVKEQIETINSSDISTDTTSSESQASEAAITGDNISQNYMYKEDNISQQSRIVSSSQNLELNSVSQSENTVNTSGKPSVYIYIINVTAFIYVLLYFGKRKIPD